MEIKEHIFGSIKIAEIISDNIVILSDQDGLDLLGNVYYQGFDRMVVHENNIVQGFFDLKNKMAGEILQKFSNYRVKLAIVGDFDKYNSKSVRDFIRESNKLGHICFVKTLHEALTFLSK